MKVTSGWIKEWLGRTMLNDSELVKALERAGIEIEQFTSSSLIDNGVVVALVKKVIQHPAADRLKLVEVNVGERNYRIVCGADNVRAGIKVALAQVGAQLPGGERIAKAKLRGELSEGMLCSERELNLGQDHNGILEVSSSAKVGTPINEIYLSDAAIDIKTPPNRWDIQSVYGLAREVAAMTEEKLEKLSPPLIKTKPNRSFLSDKTLADRYIIAHMEVSPNAPSPSVITARLRVSGVRSIGAVVDITNYVMLETGQPLHAFDASKVTLPLTVRYAQVDETLETLDGITRKLSEDDLVVADQTGPIALAGLMGGKATEVTANTTQILLESAVFSGNSVRKTAQRHGLRTEASSRYERNLPTALPPVGLARAAELLENSASGKLIGAYEVESAPQKSWSIALEMVKLNQIMGIVISYKEAIDALRKLDIMATPSQPMQSSKTSNENQTINIPAIPWWRPDLKEPADLIEEIVRVIGYDNIPSTIPSWRPSKIRFDRLRTIRRHVNDILWSAGAFEVMTYSFISTKQITNLNEPVDNYLKLQNPLSTEQAYLRNSLLPSHLATLERNRRYAKSMRFYEVSKVFMKRNKGDQPDEPVNLGVMVYEPKEAFASLKGIIDAIMTELNVRFEIKPTENTLFARGRVGGIWVGGKQIGLIGQLHPRHLRIMKLDGEAAFCEIDLKSTIASSTTKKYVPLGIYPTIQRDIAMLVPENITWADVQNVTSKWDISFVSDYYSDELKTGYKGMTIRIKLVLPDRTPSETEAVELQAAVMSRLGRKLGALSRD